MGLQGGYTNIFFHPGTTSIKYTPLIESEKVLPPPLYIQLELMKKIVKTMDKEGEGFLKRIFAYLIEAKLKEGIFSQPQVRKKIYDSVFKGELNKKEVAACKSFMKVVKILLGHKKDNNY